MEDVRQDAWFVVQRTAVEADVERTRTRRVRLIDNEDVNLQEVPRQQFL